MPNEALITQIENILSEVVDIGGRQEITSIVTNLEVVDASPTGLTGFVTIKDERDGDTILAKKVPGVGYAAADLVNVLFVNGTEPVAFQQASQSSGDPILVSKLVSPDETINPVISADNSGDVTIAGTGDLIVPDQIIHSGDTDTNIVFADDDIELTAGALSMLKLTETGQDLITLGPGSGDVDIDFNGDMFLQGSSGNFGVNINPPVAKFDVFAGTADALPYRLLREVVATSGGQNVAQLRAQSTGTAVAGFGASLLFGSDNGAGSLADRSEILGGYDGTSNNGFLQFRTKTTGNTMTNRMIIKGTGNVAIGADAPLAQLHIDQSLSGGAEPVLYLDQADVSEEMIEFASTIGVGNAIEAVGAKTLTVTHFIKVTIPGPLTRYIQVGTIA